ncbi:MAG TPA: ABC transporter substrate-binding protein, partial [Bacilli bacterium]
MKKLVLLGTVLILVMSTFLSGCGSNNSTEADGTGKSTKLVFWTFNELHGKFMSSLAEQWNANNPKDQIELLAETFPYDDMHNKLLVAYQSGEGAPDLSDIEISKFPNYLKGDIQMVELNGIVEPELDNVVESRFDIYSKNGKYYGIDYHVGAAVIYYNKEILDSAG